MIPLRASIHRKMLVVMLATAAFALLLTAAAMLYYDLRSFRQFWVTDLTAQADIIGFAATPAIEFEDRQAAADYLASLKGKPSIIAAAIYSANGSRFAAFTATGGKAVEFPALPALDGYSVKGNELDLFKRIVAGQEILGTVYIKAQFDVFGRLLNYAGIVGVVVLLSLPAAATIARRMQQKVTHPILEIASVARKVMDERDFSSRATKTTDDEIGVLVDAFNNMLAEIDHVIGERKRTQSALEDSESRLLELNAELEQRVEARTAQLAAANKDLEGFSYSVSHDLRAPIRAIGGFAVLLGEDHQAELSDEARRKISIIRSEAARMGRLIDDLLAFSRLGRKALEPSDLDMVELANNVYVRLNHAEPNGKVDFRLGSMPHAWGDRALFEQVWLNLLSNAIKFSAKKEQPVIEVGGITAENEHVYFVRDNGAGFDSRYQAKLFGVFQRLHREDDFPGTGVGLALVHRIVTRHGGRVWADGTPDQGATFHFSLPKEASNGGI
ncbi:MAG: sensor histidine kinase [Steroidobacteraceae bacterium]